MKELKKDEKEKDEELNRQLNQNEIKESKNNDYNQLKIKYEDEKWKNEELTK